MGYDIYIYSIQYIMGFNSTYIYIDIDIRYIIYIAVKIWVGYLQMGCTHQTISEGTLLMNHGI